MLERRLSPLPRLDHHLYALYFVAENYGMRDAVGFLQTA